MSLQKCSKKILFSRNQQVVFPELFEVLEKILDENILYTQKIVMEIDLIGFRYGV
jgi:hypothetical protein